MHTRGKINLDFGKSLQLLQLQASFLSLQSLEPNEVYKIARILHHLIQRLWPGLPLTMAPLPQPTSKTPNYTCARTKRNSDILCGIPKAKCNFTNKMEMT